MRQANPFSMLQHRSHPLRASLSKEMHARKMPHFSAPSRALQFVLLTNEIEAQAATNALYELLGLEGAPEHNQRFIAGRIGELSFWCERHTEFMSYSFSTSRTDGELFDLSAFGDVFTWMMQLPGQIIRSSHICLINQEPAAVEIETHFATEDLIISDVAQRRARIWSDFRLHPDGFGRLLILDRDLQGVESSQLVQRLQELGNYRKIALLGLPQAQSAAPLLDALEQELTGITTQLALQDADADMILGQLSSLSASLAQIVAATRYRMSATQAYAELCLDRIRRLSVEPVRGYRSLDDFTERRLLPAMRTCDAFNQRVEDLSKRVAWTSALLRTRVDTALARRNRDLLASMDRRTGLQLRLQHTVEGLSVVAVSYYALGLWHHLADALEKAGVHIAGWLDAVIIPGIIVAVWLGLRQLKKVKRLPPDAH